MSEEGILLALLLVCIFGLGAFCIWLGTRPDNTEQVLRELLELLKQEQLNENNNPPEAS